MTLPEAITRQLAGLKDLTNVTGAVVAAGGPIVFLLDEYHRETDVIQQNIVVADILVADAAVVAFGVEDVPAQTDYALATTTPESTFTRPMPPPPRRRGIFEKAVKARGYLVLGIDSPTYVHTIAHEACKYGSVAAHPAQMQRSLHFVRALFDEYVARSLAGNAVLNCGSDHNEHILAVAGSPEGERPQWWPLASFVRLTPASIPRATA